MRKTRSLATKNIAELKWMEDDVKTAKLPREFHIYLISFNKTVKYIYYNDLSFGWFASDLIILSQLFMFTCSLCISANNSRNRNTYTILSPQMYSFRRQRFYNYPVLAASTSIKHLHCLFEQGKISGKLAEFQHPVAVIWKLLREHIFNNQRVRLNSGLFLAPVWRFCMRLSSY